MSADGYTKYVDGYTGLDLAKYLISQSTVVCANCGHTSSKHSPLFGRPCNLVLGTPCNCSGFKPVGGS
jgi:hypothetical protein